jgi:hypothetical protein
LFQSTLLQWYRCLEPSLSSWASYAPQRSYSWWPDLQSCVQLAQFFDLHKASNQSFTNNTTRPSCQNILMQLQKFVAGKIQHIVYCNYLWKQIRPEGRLTSNMSLTFSWFKSMMLTNLWTRS